VIRDNDIGAWLERQMRDITILVRKRTVRMSTAPSLAPPTFGVKPDRVPPVVGRAPVAPGRRAPISRVGPASPGPATSPQVLALLAGPAVPDRNDSAPVGGVSPAAIG